ncbi:MAG: hypothetical protein JW808_03090, partial [Victivallales bacterium]|nr:hypothetical protein [Victivallales bacterium]
LKARGFSWVAGEAQRGRRELGDRLLGAVELAQSDSADDGSISEELKEAAIRKIAEQTSGMDFCRDISMRRALAVCGVMFVLLAACALLFWFFPEAALNSARRWSRPFASIGRYTFVVLCGHESPCYVPKGEAAELSVGLDSRSVWRPRWLHYGLPGYASGSALFENGEAKFKLESVHEDCDIRVRAGDASGILQVRPVHRPALLSLDAGIEYPEYTGRGRVARRLESNVLELLRGAGCSIEGVVSRNLISAVKVEDGLTTSLEVLGTKFAYPGVKADEDKIISFEWLDDLGFCPARAYDLRVDVVDDSAPFTECPGLSAFSAVLVDEALKLKVVAEDDFGVMAVGVEYYIDGGSSGAGMGQPRDFDLGAGTKSDTRLESEFVFAADMLGIAESSLVVLRSFALDYYPGRNVAFSVPYKFYVLSHEQHLRLLEERLEKIAARLEDLVRREENSLYLNEDIAGLPDEELSSSETREKLKAQIAREMAEKNELMRMSREVMETLRESLRNKKFPDGTAAEWSKIAEELKDVSSGDMESLTSALENASGSLGADPRRDSMESAVKSQKGLIEKLSKLIGSSSESLVSLALENFVMRLRKESERERGISAALGVILPSIIGLPPGDIEGENRIRLDELLSEQQVAGRNAGHIQDDLSGYFARTRIEAYKAVSDSMEEKQMRRELKGLEDGIAENFTTKSIGMSRAMGDNFAMWADMLVDSGKSKSQDAADGQPQEIDAEFIIGLLRVIQKEQNLREKTRMLDRHKPDWGEDDYKVRSLDLAYEQGDIHLYLSFLEDLAVASPPAYKLLRGAGGVMDEVVAFLRRPATDSQVVAAQTQIIEMLSGAFQEACPESPAGQMQMLAELMQMLMPEGVSGGGGVSAGGSDAIERLFKGPAFTRADDKGSPEQVQGVAPPEAPEEYREAIEAYFRRLSLIEE